MSQNNMRNMRNFSGVRVDKSTGEEYVVHKPSGVIYLLRKPIGDIATVASATAPSRTKPSKSIYPKLATARFIEGSEPKNAKS